MLHPSSINLVSLPLLLLSPLHEGNNDTLIHYPFIPVILVKLLNNMLQIRLHSHNSSCHLQYIILQTYSPLSLAFFEDYCQWHLQDTFGIWSIISVAIEELHWLICHCQSTASNSALNAKVTWVFILPQNKSSCKFMLIWSF